MTIAIQVTGIKKESENANLIGDLNVVSKNESTQVDFQQVSHQIP